MLFSRVFAVMLLVNTCVFDSCCQTTLLRWTILQSEDERLSLTDFYERVSFCTLHKVVCTVAVVTLALNCTICVCCIILFMIIMIFIVMNNGNGPPACMEFPGSPDGRETKVSFAVALPRMRIFFKPGCTTCTLCTRVC